MWSLARLQVIRKVSRPINMTKTQKIESIHFKIFRKKLNNFPDGEVWHEDKPDFWVKTNSGVLGIEHCLIHIPHHERTPLQAIESQTDEIISIAQEHAELRGTPEVHAKFLFNNNFKPLNKKQRVNLGREISLIIHNKILEEKNITPFQSIDIRQNLPTQLKLIHFIFVEQNMRHRWHCARAGWALTNTQELFQNTIDNKGKKHQEYLKKCKECWLLMLAGMKPSGFIHPNAKSIEHVYFSSFKRTYFLDCNQDKLYLLKTKNG